MVLYSFCPTPGAAPLIHNAGHIAAIFLGINRSHATGLKTLNGFIGMGIGRAFTHVSGQRLFYVHHISSP